MIKHILRTWHYFVFPVWPCFIGKKCLPLRTYSLSVLSIVLSSVHYSVLSGDLSGVFLLYSLSCTFLCSLFCDGIGDSKGDGDHPGHGLI